DRPSPWIRTAVGGGNPRTLPVLRFGRTERYGVNIPHSGACRMSMLRTLGIDNLSEEYAYGIDPNYGYTSAKKIADKWVATTCGYCSVGCGMQIGVKDGRAVAVRGLDSHPVNSGKLCPKGLAEHYPIESSDRVRYPLLRKNGKLVRVDWDEALGTMIE